MQKNWQKLKQSSEFKKRLLLRENLIDALRLFFKQQGFHEVETPLALRYPGTEPYLNSFITTLQLPNGYEQSASLSTSPEYAMKKLLAAGLGNIFQICKAFRNGENLGGLHNPEFTIMECYRIDADYNDLMVDFAALLSFICQGLAIDAHKVVHQGTEFDLVAPYPRFSVAELFKKYLGLTTDEFFDLEVLRQQALSLAYDLSGLVNLSPALAWEKLYNQLFLNEIQPHLAKFLQPVIIYDYPAQQTALAKRKDSDPRFAERFEIYLAGMELVNACSELIDANKQRAYLLEDLKLRQELGKPEQAIDQDFLQALELGMPKAAGMAIGVDRLLMFLANANDIDQVLFFPASETFLD